MGLIVIIKTFCIGYSSIDFICNEKPKMFNNMLIDKLPLLKINDQYMDYPSAMRQLKNRAPLEERATTAAEN